MNPALSILLIVGAVYAVALGYLVWMIVQANRTGKDPS